MSLICIIIDHFYAVVEAELNPNLMGIAFAVTNGEVIVGLSPECSSLSEIRTGITEALAREKAPSLLILKGDMERYRSASRNIAASLKEIAFQVTELNPGKFKLDITGCPLEKLTLESIRAELVSRLKPHNFRAGKAQAFPLAEIAAKTAGKNSLIEIPPGDERDFLKKLPIEMHPVLRRFIPTMRQMGINKIGDLLQMPKPVLRQIFAGDTDRILRFAAGDFKSIRRSWVKINRSFRFSRHNSDLENELFTALPRMVKEMMNRRLKAVSIFLALNYADKVASVKRMKFPPTRDEVELGKALKSLLKQTWKRRVRPESAIIEITAEPDDGQISFWNDNRRDQIADSVDKVRDRFGAEAVNWLIG